MSKFFDVVTNTLARRPSGVLARMLYRNPIGHGMSFQMALEVLKLSPEDHLLEVGSGGGVFMRQALKSGCTALAIDHSPDMVRATVDANSSAMLEKRLVVQKADAIRIPAENGTVSKIACLNAFFFFAEPQRVINEFKRVLRKDGHVVIFTAPPEARRKIKSIVGPIADRMRFDSPQDLKLMAMNAGFQSTEAATAPNGGLLFQAWSDRNSVEGW